MGRRFGFLLKMLAGAYLIFVGVTLLQTFLDERPSNLQAMCVTASLFILAGAGYIIILFWGLLKRKTAAFKPYKEETEIPVQQGPVRNSSILRTAPMTVLREERQDIPSEGGFNHEKQAAENPPDRTEDGPSGQLQDRKTSVIHLQTVGPETMVWKK